MVTTIQFLICYMARPVRLISETKFMAFRISKKNISVLGTGKTKTVVAAVEKIVRSTTKNILVCAQSNSACNEIAERLAMVLTSTQMFRMFSASYELDKISPKIQPFCNLFDGELKFPSLEYLYEFRVLICTLSTAGNLVRACGSIPSHFGYVFIDECASATVTMSLIPIAGKDTVWSL